MTDVRTFRAETMQAALELVRRELGREAVILHTRQVTKKRLLPWRPAVEEVEIMATIDERVPSITGRTRQASPPPSRTNDPAPRRTPAPAAKGVELAFQAAGSASRPLAARTERSPATPVRATAARETARSPEIVDADDEQEYLVDPKPLATAPSVKPRLRDSAIENRNRAIDRLSDSPSFSPTEARSPRSELSNGSASDATAQFAERLNSIERMLQQLGRSVRTHQGEEIPPELFQVFTRLIDQDVDDGLARELVYRVRQNAPLGALASPEFIEQRLATVVESDLKCGETIAPKPGQRMVVALVGSTGVGKTTTLAKLAANFKLRDRLKVGLVTVDTYRIAAVEQLRTYADIIDLPMKVVTSPSEMRRALDELTGLDLVLVDTAGRSPRDDQQIFELRQLLEAADADQTHLVLGLTAGKRHLEQTIRKFSTVQATSVILTKLDEAAGLGSLLTVSSKLPLPISYITTGQDVPDDIEFARPGRLARLALGLEELKRSRAS